MGKFKKDAAFRNAVVQRVNALNVSNTEIGGVPLAVGDNVVINVQQPLAVQTFNGGNSTHNWLPIHTVDGGVLSAKQLVRARNGLSLSANTFADRLAEVFMKSNDEGILTLQVTGIRTRDFTTDSGTTTATYYVFSLQ